MGVVACLEQLKVQIGCVAVVEGCAKDNPMWDPGCTLAMVGDNGAMGSTGKTTWSMPALECDHFLLRECGAAVLRSHSIYDTVIICNSTHYIMIADNGGDKREICHGECCFSFIAGRYGWHHCQGWQFFHFYHFWDAPLFYHISPGIMLHARLETGSPPIHH